MRIILLGTGTSHGVPTIDCMLDDYIHCPNDVCRKAESDPRYRRTRASILVQANGKDLLIDTSQDFRQQMLANHVRNIDAVLYTHGHADHIYGLPDIRSYCRHQNDAIDIYGSRETLGILQQAFDYAFHPPAFVGGGIPRLRPHILDAPMRLGGDGVTIIPIPVVHGSLTGCQGYRIEDMAYIPDAKQIPPESMHLLQSLDVLIINCLRITSHASHLSLSESLAIAHRLRPKRCFLTHMTHDIDFEAEERSLPQWVRFAYDGEVVTL